MIVYKYQQFITCFLYVSREAALYETNQRKWVPRIHRTAPALLSKITAQNQRPIWLKRCPGELCFL